MYFYFQGIPEVTTSIWRWIFLATTVGPIAAPIMAYSMICFGLMILVVVFVKAYKKFVIGQNSIEIVEIGRETIRRGSTLIMHSSQKLIPHKENSYHLLNTIPSTPNIAREVKLQEFDRREFSQSLDELKSSEKTDFVRTNFSDIERESLIRSDNTFILSELRRYSLLKIADDL